MDHGNGQQIDGRVIKVSYSNHIRRKDFLGDKGEIETNNQNATTLFLGYHENSLFPSESTIKEYFSKFGELKAIYLKQAPPNTFVKSHIFIDYELHECAESALYDLTKNDDDNAKKILGDPLLEADYSFRKKYEVISRTKLEPQELLKYMMELLQPGPDTDLSQNPVFVRLNTLTPEQEQSILGALNSINKNPANVGQNLVLVKGILQKLGINVNMPKMNIPYTPIPSMMINPIMPPMMPPIPPPPTRPSSNKQDEILDIMQKLISSEKPSREKEEAFDEEKHLWSGFMTRSKMHRVGVDAYLIKGNSVAFDDYNLNISHRINYEELLKRENDIIGVIVFTAQNETQAEQFDEYISYLNDKQRAGIICTSKGYIYILPPSELSKRYYEGKMMHMVGLVVTNQAYKKSVTESIEEN